MIRIAYAPDHETLLVAGKAAAPDLLISGIHAKRVANNEYDVTFLQPDPDDSEQGIPIEDDPRLDEVIRTASEDPRSIENQQVRAILQKDDAAISEAELRQITLVLARRLL